MKKINAYVILPSFTIFAGITCIFLGIYHINTDNLLSPIFGICGFGLFGSGLSFLDMCYPPHNPISVSKEKIGEVEIGNTENTIKLPGYSNQTEILTQPIEIPTYASVMTKHEEEINIEL